MSNQIGNTLQIQLFGASHAFGVGASLVGLPPGLLIDEEVIRKQLKRRQTSYTFNTPRHETDDFTIISGEFGGKTTGEPLTILVYNKQQHSDDYDLYSRIMRSGHADYVSHVKYHGYNDYRGGGIFSGRMTVALVALGAIARDILFKKNILIGSHLQQIQSLSDNYCPTDLEALIKDEQEDNFIVYDKDVKQLMLQRVQDYQQQEDSLGAIVETNILNLPVGLGEPFFWSLESAIAQAIFSIPGNKALEFGSGFSLVAKAGSEVNDSLYYTSDKKIKTRTNHLGGINGGISNGMPLSFKTMVRPPASIGKLQKTIDLEVQENISHFVKGRHDSFIANRTLVVIDNLIAFIILDLATANFGKEWIL